MSLLEERQKWRDDMKAGKWVDPPWLADYRANKDSGLWRSTRPLELLCQYILFLEDEVKTLRG